MLSIFGKLNVDQDVIENIYNKVKKQEIISTAQLRDIRGVTNAVFDQFKNYITCDSRILTPIFSFGTVV